MDLPRFSIPKAMSHKCVHKGCGKKFTEFEEECVYHPGPPIFHEGQKGVWAPSNNPEYQPGVTTDMMQ